MQPLIARLVLSPHRLARMAGVVRHRAGDDRKQLCIFGLVFSQPGDCP
jgi:streptomycin 6-kinase